MTAYRLGAVVIFALALVVSAHAQVVLHGKEYLAGEAHPATGSFSIRFPIPYKDVEYQGAEQKGGDGRESASAVHMLSGVEPNQDYFFRLIRSKTAGYVLIVQFPTGLHNKAIGMKDDFFGSFKIVPH